ncbi:MAG: crossover junction endodeoxyribonuclease RuvC [Clostridia bacterium]|nr:crossover junction endodeoxyribonuclease RuvC [Clostridia bacterium]
MIILGIDPGYAIVGFGVIGYSNNKAVPIEYGAITTPAHVKTELRLCEIYDGICELCDKFRPDAISIEELFFNTNAKTAVNVCQARGVILLAATRAGIPIFEYTPLQIKQAVTGYGRAEKHQMISMVTTLLNLKSPPKPDDTADALAAAICHGYCSSSALFKLQ